jgi:hypothetical protein
MRGAGIAVVATACAILAGANQAWAQSSAKDVEEIYIARSVRLSRVVPSDYCSPTKTGFAPALEDQLTIKSIATDPSDGRLTGSNAQDIGDMRVCIGQAMDPAVLGTYAEGHIAGVPFTGLGDCRLVRGNQPEQGLLTHRCFMSLSSLPAPYVGGFIVGSSLYSSTPFGTDTTPPGYTQASIMIVRLWKRRKP